MAPAQSKHADVEMGQEEALLPLHLDAIRCWYRANDDMRAAIKAFLQPDPSRVLLNSSRFIATSVKRLEGHYSLRKEPAKGQPNKVPDETAKKALEILWAGFEAEGKRVYWDSIEDACEESPGLKAIKEQCGCCPRTLLRAMRRVERECRRRVERAVRPFTPENKRARQDACKFLLKCPVNYLRRIFWLDAATIYVVPKNMTVYAPPCARLVVSDPRLAGHSLVRRKLKFYILVNAIAGPVALEFVTGTTDLEAEEVWLTAKGETAKGCTMEEWKAVMAKFQAAAEKVVRSAEWRGKLGRVRPLWSFDNDRIHTNVFVLATLKINKRNRPPLPANSPDMHGVVERCIQRLKRAFHKWLYRHPADRTMEQYQQALRELFFTNKKVASRKVIDSQVLFMPEVYAAIASPSVKGDHPPKKYK